MLFREYILHLFGIGFQKERVSWVYSCSTNLTLEYDSSILAQNIRFISAMAVFFCIINYLVDDVIRSRCNIKRTNSINVL